MWMRASGRRGHGLAVPHLGRSDAPRPAPGLMSREMPSVRGQSRPAISCTPHVGHLLRTSLGQAADANRSTPSGISCGRSAARADRTSVVRALSLSDRTRAPTTPRPRHPRSSARSRPPRRSCGRGRRGGSTRPTLIAHAICVPTAHLREHPDVSGAASDAWTCLDFRFPGPGLLDRVCVGEVSVGRTAVSDKSRTCSFLARQLSPRSQTNSVGGSEGL